MASKGLKIVSLNVHSLYPHLDELYIHFKDFDILCFCETWLNSSYTDQLISMQGFEIFRLDREKGNVKNKMNKPKRGGGIIMYVKKGLSECTTILENESSISENLEQLWIRIEKPNVKTKIIANIYRPPNGKLLNCINELTYSTTLAQNTYNGELTIVGDFNVNYNARNTPRHVVHGKTCLDLIFTNMDHVVSSGVINIKISVHLPIFMVKKK